MEMVLKPRPLGLGCLHSMGHLLRSAPGATKEHGGGAFSASCPCSPSPTVPQPAGICTGRQRTVVSAPQLPGSSAGRACCPRSRCLLSLLQQHEVLLLPLSQIRGLSFTLRMGASLLIHGPHFGLVPCGHWSPRTFLRHRGPCQPIFLADTQRQSEEELIREC